jgi:hypothetical protein
LRNLIILVHLESEHHGSGAVLFNLAITFHGRLVHVLKVEVFLAEAIPLDGIGPEIGRPGTLGARLPAALVFGAVVLTASRVSPVVSEARVQLERCHLVHVLIVTNPGFAFQFRKIKQISLVVFFFLNLLIYRIK